MLPKIPPRQFYSKNTKTVAKKLLGKMLLKETSNTRIISGKIVETEAYLGETDPGSHTYKGIRTKRNEPMWGKAGFTYVYFTYGMHNLINIVTEKEKIPRAVLIRALEPIYGIKIMKKNRNMQDIKNLTNGPAKLTQALGITLKDNVKDVTSKSSDLRIQDYEEICSDKIISRGRVGIKEGAEELLRFYIKGNKFVSVK